MDINAIFCGQLSRQRGAFLCFLAEFASRLKSERFKFILMDKLVFYSFYNQFRMFLHQALPKDTYSCQKPLYSIKKSSSKGRREINSESVTTALKLKLPQQSFKRSRSHSMKSTQKPNINISQRDHLPFPKHISSIGLQRNGNSTPQRIVSSSRINNTIVFSNKYQRQSFGTQQKDDSLFLICKIQNKAVQPSNSPFQWNDLALIDRTYHVCYEGQTKGERIRHGFGTQWYSNGQKFVGIFENDKASGHGTYYGLRKKVIGFWQSDCLRQIFMEL